MSFFNNLQQYVTSSVANLSLSPKRFSLSRESSSATTSEPTDEYGNSNNSGRSASTGSVTAVPGFPKVVPPPGTSTPTRRKTLEYPKKITPFRQPAIQRQPMMFCRRRPSWPEVDVQTKSGVQETDGSFFENYTIIAWKLQNKRLISSQDHSQEDRPPPDSTFGIKPPPTYRIQSSEKEQLYLEVLYTIKYKVGSSCGQGSPFQEELYSYAQKAFKVPNDMHRRYLNIASEEKPPIIVLNVVVIEAEGLEAKDANGHSDPYCLLGIRCRDTQQSASHHLHHHQQQQQQCQHQYSQNLDLSTLQRKDDTTVLSPIAVMTGILGFSDPYCMLGIQPGHAMSPPPATSPGAAPALSNRGSSSRALSEGGVESADPKHDHPEKLRKHHSFRLSFKRKDRREHRDSISSEVPAKFIRATSVRPQTLNPRWNEKFRFDIDDISNDVLHLDIWDHDDESSVLEAVIKLNEVRGVKGLGRFFKQIAQSARSGSQDDFLGCVNIPLHDVPTTGIESWYKLEGRTQRSNIQGRIRLKMWLSKRENRGNSEEEGNLSYVKQQEKLYVIFINHEMIQNASWNGELSHAAQNILHQHAIQGDISDLQNAVVEWSAYSRVCALNPKILYPRLENLEELWHTEALSREEEDCLADSFNVFLEYALQLIKKHRRLFPTRHQESMSRLEHLLRCLGLLANMKSFWKCCPFNKELRGEITCALRKGTIEWYEDNAKIIAITRSDPDLRIKGLVKLFNVVLVGLKRGIDHYNALFENHTGVQYFATVYKQFEKQVLNDLQMEIVVLCKDVKVSEIGTDPPPLPTSVEIGTTIFKLYFVVQEFANLQEHLPNKSLGVMCYYQWFEPAVDKWIDLAKFKALRRVKKAIEFDKICSGEQIVKHGTSAIDVAAIFYQMKEFWKQLAWPDCHGCYNFVIKIMDTISECGRYYAELMQRKLKETGYYEDQTPYKTTDPMCVTANNLEYVRRALSAIPSELCIDALLESMRNNENYEAPYSENLTVFIDECVSDFEEEIGMIMNRVAVKMRSPIKKAMFHLAWSPDSLPTVDAIAPLLEYLDSHLTILNPVLLPRNFERVLLEIWEVCVTELGHQTDGSVGDKLSGFYDRLYEALDLLIEFFYSDGKGLTVEVLNGETFKRVKEGLQYHKTDTEQLTCLYYNDRLREQAMVESSEYGVLTVRAYYHHDSLCIEILNARDVIPLDPNGFSDPFVIIELLPKSLFPNCPEQHTNVQKKTLNPFFDECFEFSVTLEQCQTSGAMISFTVMDHDVLTANDFAGEAFLSLGTIPGVISTCNSDTFHGLKPVDLRLMHQKSKHHPILQILESRTWDKLATDFVKKQKPRIAG